MLSLYKTVSGAWERARGPLREDLLQIEIVINHLWAKALGFDFILKNTVIGGDGGVIRTGEDGNVTTGDVLLTDLEVIPPSTLLGRGSLNGEGDIELITLGSGLTMTDTVLDVNAGASVGNAVALHTLCGGI